MINAKDEFLQSTKNYNVIAANIKFNEDDYSLMPLYKKKEYDNFLKFIDKNYDAGYGAQLLFGIILCEDGIWFTRGEYDGSGWWKIHKYPDMKKIFGEKITLRYNRHSKLKFLKELNNEK